MSDSELNVLREEVACLRREMTRLQDESAIRQLQYRYGYYDEFYQWDRLLDLFTDDCSVEIGARGKYVGKARVERFYREIIAENRTHLSKNQVYNHLQLQMVITLSADGVSAKGRSRALIFGSRSEDPSLLLAEGVYENAFVKEGADWKIQHLYWAPTFYAKIVGVEPLKFAGIPASTVFPPDATPRSPDPIVGRTLVAYHY